jgi:hypothetical protein
MNHGHIASARRSRLGSVAAVLFALELLVGNVRAADKLQADLMPQVLRARTEAPIPIQVRFKWESTHILEGRLEVELHEGNLVLARYHSGDLALTAGEQSFHMVLPPCKSPYSDSQVEAQLKFVSADQVFDLGSSILFMSTMGERSLVVGWCNPRNGVDVPTSGLERNLLFEQFAPPSADVSRRLLVTSIARMTPEDLPSQPLGYTSYDVVVLTADAFADAREAQLHALARWVKGGGGVCVFAAGTLRPYHLQFLNELAESSAAEPAFLADNDGHLLPPRKKVLCLHSGMGRSVVVAGNTAADSVSEHSTWRQALAFLWKFRINSVRSIAETGHWENPNVSDESESLTVFRQNQRGQQGFRRWPDATTGQQQSYSIQPTQIGAELVQELMPRTVRLIPFKALIGTLGLFVLMIGPLDYYVLGFLRRRRYTWMLFPVTSVAFAVATVLMANHYLGQHDQRRSLVVVDIGKDGTALRWNRYELVFAARDKQAVTELKDSLWAHLDLEMAPGMPYNSGYGYARRELGRESSLPVYEGPLPVHFRASQSIRQWRPELNRTFSFEPPPIPLLLNWGAVDKAWPNLEAVRAQLSGNKTFAGDVCAISGTNSITLDPGSRGILSSDILQQLCVGESEGLLSLISQVSPTGGGNFEDISALDAGAGDSVLAIVTKSGDDIVVYRRFFYGN